MKVDAALEEALSFTKMGMLSHCARPRGGALIITLVCLDAYLFSLHSLLHWGIVHFPRPLLATPFTNAM